MKRMLFSFKYPNKRDGPLPTSEKWRAQEWAKQLNDLERYLAFCNRRNNVSKIRLL